MIAPNTPVACPKFLGSEKTPAPTMEPTTIAVNVGNDSFCSDFTRDVFPPRARSMPPRSLLYAGGDSAVGVEVLRLAVHEVVKCDGLGVFERIVRGHQEMGRADREQVVGQALRLAEDPCLHGVEDEGELEPTRGGGRYLVPDVRAGEEPDVGGRVEGGRGIGGWRQIRDGRAVEGVKDLVEDETVERVARAAVGQHGQRDAGRREDTEAGVLADRAAVVGVDRL